MTRDEQEQTALMGGSAFQETEMDDHLTRVAEAPQTDQTAAPGAIIQQFGYQPLFNAISAATEWMEGRMIGISVAAFEASLLAAAPEVPEPVLDHPASIGGTTFGVGIPVRTLVAAAQRRNEVEQTPASLADRQALIDALRRPIVDAEIATLREQNAALVAAVEATLFHVNNNAATINSSVVCELHDALARVKGGV